MSLYQTNVIVLRARNLGEADRVLVLLSEDQGKFEAVVKGARRGRSRFVGNTLPFNFLKALFFTGKNLDTLNQAELVHSFTKLREDLAKLAYASYWVEMVDGFVPERQEVTEVFRFLLASFIVLEQTAEPEMLNQAFQVRLLHYLGYHPELDHCVVCGNELRELIYFSAHAGGIVCGKCRPSYADVISTPAAAVELYKKLVITDLREVAQTTGNEEAVAIVSQILRSYIETRLERPLKSQVFLDNLLRQ